MLRTILQFRNYIIVGLINFLVCVLSMKTLATMGVNYLTYTPIGYWLAIICSFFLNLNFTFQESNFSKLIMFKFISFSLLNLVIVELIEYFLIEKLGTEEVKAIIIGMAWYTITGFIVNKLFVYSPSPSNTLLQNV